MNNLRIILAILLIVGSTSLSRAEQARTPAEDLPSLVTLALVNNPELKSSQARWRMYVSKARQAGTFDDPMVMFKLQNMVARYPLSFDKDPMTSKVIGISQQLPFWGKRAAREEMAEFEAESFRWSIEERKLELTRMVKETYYQIYAVDKSLEIIDANLQIMSDFITIAESKYSVGQGVQQDIYKGGLEKSKLLDMQITLRQQRKSLEANLNYLLFRDPSTPIGAIADFELPKPQLSAPMLQERAYAKRPQVKSLISLANKGEASRRLAQKEFYPDFNVSLEYMFREPTMNEPGNNMFSLGLTFNLPLQRQRRQAMVAESSSETTMSLEELNALKNSIAYSINDLLVQMDRRQKLVELYRGGIVPQAEQSLESATIGYQVNKVDFLSLLDARVNLFNYQRELYDSKAEYMMKLAQLEAVVGTELVKSESQKQ